MAVFKTGGVLPGTSVALYLGDLGLAPTAIDNVEVVHGQRFRNGSDCPGACPHTEFSGAYNDPDLLLTEGWHTIVFTASDSSDLDASCELELYYSSLALKSAPA